MSHSVMTAPLGVREAAEQRRSIRAFEPGPLPWDDLEAILDVARRAPSAFNLQPWRFIVAQSQEMRAHLATAGRNQRQLLGAPAIVVLYTDMEDALQRVDEVLHPGMQGEQRERARAGILGAFAEKGLEEREAWGAEQGYIALGYLLLAAEAHGYQTSPMLGFDPRQVRDALHLPSHVRIPALIAIGRGAEEGFPQHRHALERIARAA